MLTLKAVYDDRLIFRNLKTDRGTNLKKTPQTKPINQFFKDSYMNEITQFSLFFSKTLIFQMLLIIYWHISLSKKVGLSLLFRIQDNYVFILIHFWDKFRNHRQIIGFSIQLQRRNLLLTKKIQSVHIAILPVFQISCISGSKICLLSLPFFAPKDKYLENKNNN